MLSSDFCFYDRFEKIYFTCKGELVLLYDIWESVSSVSKPTDDVLSLLSLRNDLYIMYGLNVFVSVSSDVNIRWVLTCFVVDRSVPLAIALGDFSTIPIEVGSLDPLSNFGPVPLSDRWPLSIHPQSALNVPNIRNCISEHINIIISNY